MSTKEDTEKRTKPIHRSVLTLTCPKSLRAQWRDPLAEEWLREYPMLFDEDDLRITKKGRAQRLHFNEWFAAIHLYKERGVLSLVEKYVHKKAHPRKWKVIDKHLPEDDRQLIRSFRGETGGMLPDLFVYSPGSDIYWFAEVKGPGDSLSKRQVQGHDILNEQLGVPVQIITVRHVENIK